MTIIHPLFNQLEKAVKEISLLNASEQQAILNTATLDTKFSDFIQKLQMDSLDLIEFFMVLEEELNKEIPDRLVDEIMDGKQKSLQDVLDSLQNL